MALSIGFQSVSRPDGNPPSQTSRSRRSRVSPERARAEITFQKLHFFGWDVLRWEAGVTFFTSAGQMQDEEEGIELLTRHSACRGGLTARGATRVHIHSVSPPLAVSPCHPIKPPLKKPPVPPFMAARWRGGLLASGLASAA